jgi:hypothetical protein
MLKRANCANVFPQETALHVLSLILASDLRSLKTFARLPIYDDQGMRIRGAHGIGRVLNKQACPHVIV